jgi:hypothetical protein
LTGVILSELRANLKPVQAENVARGNSETAGQQKGLTPSDPISPRLIAGQELPVMPSASIADTRVIDQAGPRTSGGKSATRIEPGAKSANFSIYIVRGANAFITKG